MNIILLSKTRKSPININLRRGTVVTLLAVVFVGMPFFFVSLGYGVALLRSNPASGGFSSNFNVLSQRDDVDRVVEDAKYSINALTQRLGEIQARAIRLDALGKRLVELSNLDKGEFNFDKPPGVGGPETTSISDKTDLKEFKSSLDQLERQLENREQQLIVLETLMMNKILLQETVPAGWPIRNGWISSHFGKRTDPFTGLKAMHYGLDFAAKEGSDVVAVASGVVTWSGPRFGYGTMVEIDHGNGYVTRYAHNSENLVNVGDVVHKGQVVGLMGSSGRSTGPHVHFEVLRNGQAVDPINYVQASR